MKISVVVPNYNHASSVMRCLDALYGQKIHESNQFTVIVVDDGSTDDSVSSIRLHYGDHVRLIELGSNQGRSTARNTGVRKSEADYIVFIDSDCVAADDQFIQAYIDAVSKGADLVFGQVSARNDSFWDLLQKSTFSNRLDEFRSGRHWSYTTQNVCIKRDLFLQTGGFDLAFDKHGFEDRDLFIRLIGVGANPAYCDDANVIHDDKISLASVSAKMLAAGKHVAIPFREKHPSHYMVSPYAKLDCGIHPWLKWLDALLWPIASRMARGNADWLENRHLPLQLRIYLARLVYGLHYLHGTALATKKSGQD